MSIERPRWILNNKLIFFPVLFGKNRKWGHPLKARVKTYIPHPSELKIDEFSVEFNYTHGFQHNDIIANKILLDISDSY